MTPPLGPGARHNREPLEELDHPRIVNLRSYLSAGRIGAVEQTLLRTGVARKLRNAATRLPEGFGFAVFDAWRPLQLQETLYQETYREGGPTREGYVSTPTSDPAEPPPHLTGGCLDLTLTWEGHVLELGTGFDCYTEEAATDAFEQRPGKVRSLRRLLYWTMRKEGFVALDREWWHYEYGTRRWATLTGNPPIYGAAQPPPVGQE